MISDLSDNRLYVIGLISAIKKLVLGSGCWVLAKRGLLLGAGCLLPGKRGLVLGAVCWVLVCLSLSGQTCTISATHNDVACYGESTGTINITVIGGSEPYAFLWTGPGSFSSTSQNLTGLSAGIYIVSVTGNEGSCSGTGTVTIEQPVQPLLIITQPADQRDCYGNTVEFSVETSNSTGLLQYQWQSRPPGGNFSDITGETSADLTVHDIGVNGENIDDTEYRVIITDDCSAVTSENAVLYINSVTGLTGHVNLTICDGGNTSYEVSTDGPVTGYQWSFNDGTGWQPISDGAVYSGTTTQQLNISNATSAETGGYRVSVTYVTLNQPPDYSTCVITTFTRNRNLTVLPPVSPPVVTADQTFCNVGTPDPLTATAATGGSGPPFSYQWQISTDHENWSNIIGEQSLLYSPPPLTTTTLYRIAVTDEGPMSCGTVYSYPVTINVSPLPVTSAIYHH